MDKKYSRLHLTGRLNCNTPFEVIQFICDCCNLELPEQLTESELDRIIFQLNEPLYSPTVNHYINPYQSIDGKNYDELIDIIEKFVTTEPTKIKLNVGYLTPECPEVIDPAMLYQLCCHHGIDTCRTTTMDQMKISLEVFFCQARHTLIQQIITQVTSMSIHELCSLKNKIEICNTAGSSIDEEVISVLGMKPENVCNLVAHKFKIDITMSKYPVDEYMELLRIEKNYSPPSHHSSVSSHLNPSKNMSTRINQSSRVKSSSKSRNDISNKLSGESLVDYCFNNYKPKDLIFRNIFFKQPTSFDVRRSFNPNLKMSAFDKDDLIKILVNQGQQDQGSITENYKMLCKLYSEESFYPYDHRMEFRESSSPIYLTSVDEIPKNEFIGYGIFPERMVPMMTSELTEYFKNCKMFMNPFGGSFSSDAIKKLDKMAETHDWTELHNIIREINEYMREIDGTACRIRYDFIQGSSTFKDGFLDAVGDLFKIGMYMRNWKGPGYAYPMNSSDTICSIEDFKRIDLIVFNVVTEMYDKISNQLNVGYLCFMNALMMQYNNRGRIDQKKYELYPGEMKIIDRIKIIVENNGEKSCIRSSSNYLIATSNFYHYLVKNEYLINIGKLSYIF